MSFNSNDDLRDATYGISCDWLVAKLLEPYSKESRVNEIKEKDFQEQEENAEKEQEAEFAQLVSNMWHSEGATGIETDRLKALKKEDSTQHELFLEGTVKMVSELLSKLKADDKEAVSRTFLAMSSSSESCTAIRQSKCLPVLIGLIHGEESNEVIREQASKALHSIILHGTENKQGRREAMVYKLIEQLLKYCEQQENIPKTFSIDTDEVPTATQTVALLMKFSFNEEYRHAMCEFGALHALAKLIQSDHITHSGDVENLPSESITIRRYAAMALTNLTFRDSNSKVLLCSFKVFMQVLVAQLQSPNEDLCQVTASVLRNLSWRADSYVKKELRDIDAVTSLMKTALRVHKESTLKAVLSALWNLSAHSNLNKVDICNVDGAIEFLVKMLNYQAPSGTLVIVENVGGIFRNISSLIAVRDDYRVIIRNFNCLYVLLHQLTSPSLTVVSNACGTLWNLSARCGEDQNALISLGAIDMLRSLIHSKHKMISVACSAALKNLMNARVDTNATDNNCDRTLFMRKKKVLDQEINVRFRETSDISPTDISPCYERLSTNTIYPEHSFSHKNLPFHHSEVNPLRIDANTLNSEPSSLAQKPLSLRFNFASDDENNREDKNRTEPEPIKGILTSGDQGTGSRSNCYLTFNCSGEDYDLQSNKMNGFRKIEEPYNIDESFGDYAETDLDQPTNYSLQFREQGRLDSEQNECMVVGAIDGRCATDTSDKKNLSVQRSSPCHETPLMFSRSSSLGSVSSCSEAADELGSVVSDFSHAVSGIISPSELPASPSETVPPSPLPIVKNDVFFETKSIAIPSSVFEDSVTIFKDENTPNQFSVATSLSSLTFEEDTPAQPPLLSLSLQSMLQSKKSQRLDELEENPCVQDDNVVVSTKCEIPVSSTVTTTAISMIDSREINNEEEKEDSVDVDLSPEEEQAVLNACIDRGMPTLRKYRPANELSASFIASSPNNDMMQPVVASDSTINYCTEDTPLSISHAVSNSDLSLLCPSEDSFLQNSILPLSSCADDHDAIELPDEEQEKLLNLCIATGQSLNFNSNNSLDDTRSSQSSTLSEITEDLPIEDLTMLKDIAESAHLVKTDSSTENDYSFLPDVDGKELSEEQSENALSVPKCPVLSTLRRVGSSVYFTLDQNCKSANNSFSNSDLLNQCIALGMQNMKDSTDRIIDFSDLENIGPPSFFADANLDNSLTNVEEITDYPSTKNEKSASKLRRHQLKERYHTYTVSPSTTKFSQTHSTENVKKLTLNKDRRVVEKDRFKTRTLRKNDFEEMTMNRESESPKLEVKHCLDEIWLQSDNENYQDSAEITKQIPRVKSGIPVVKSKLPAPKNTCSCLKSPPPNELPILSLHRQNTFTKDEPSAIPVRKNSIKNNAKSTASETSLQFKSGIPSRIKEQPHKASRVLNIMGEKSPDFIKNEWSMSENNLNSSAVLKTASNTNLNGSLPANAVVSKLSPSTSQSALPVRRELSNKNTNQNVSKK